ncbi:MAG: hypothetical protein ACXVIM_10565 [Acidimicrobiia bacterium]
MRFRVIASVATLVVVAAACDGFSSTRTVEPRAGQFRLDEWSITADQPTLSPGSQTITAANLGHHTHELVIVKAADAASLPTKSDASVDEAKLEAVKIGEIADVPAGTSRHTTMQLGPGRYVAFCNIVGGTGMGNGPMGGMGGGMQHVHFELGMHTTFTVASGS